MRMTRSPLFAIVVVLSSLGCGGTDGTTPQCNQPNAADCFTQADGGFGEGSPGTGGSAGTGGAAGAAGSGGAAGSSGAAGAAGAAGGAGAGGANP